MSTRCFPSKTNERLKSYDFLSYGIDIDQSAFESRSVDKISSGTLTSDETFPPFCNSNMQLVLSVFIKTIP